MPESYYNLLGVHQTATPDEIESALRDKRRHWGRRASNAPRLEDRQEAELMLQELEAAERTLSDPTNRLMYDHENGIGHSATPPSPTSGGPGFPPASYPTLPLQDTTRLRVPATRLFEAVHRQQTGNLGRTITHYNVQSVTELIITDKRLVVLNQHEIAMQMELDPGLLAEAQQAAVTAPEVAQLPFLGFVKSKQHIFRMRQYHGGSATTAATGCLGVIFGYWFILIALFAAGAIGESAHSPILVVVLFIAAVAALRVRPRRTVELRPLHAMPLAGGLMSALIRHAGASGMGWEYEVQVAPENHEDVVNMLQPVAATMQQVVRRGSGL
jgi:DnaJ domain